MTKKYDVIISGAGPVGLFLACELALAKCSVLILEKSDNLHSPLKKRPFGIRGLSSLSIEHLFRRGLLEKLEIHKTLKNPHMNAIEGPNRQVGHFAGIPFTEGNVDPSRWQHRLPSSLAPNLISEMEELETIFTTRALELGVEIIRGVDVNGFEEKDGEIIVKATPHEFHALWLVGCDGARSVIRKCAGIDFEGTEPEFTGYSTKIDLADPEKLKPGRVMTDDGMYMQSQPGFIVIQDFDGGAFHRSGEPLTREHVEDVLRRISGTDVAVSHFHYGTTWTDRARQAKEYRKGKVLLAGDAAHIHSPLGGQGLNLGLGDAMNLGWKLAAVIHENAPESLLNTYHTERHPVGEQVLGWSRAQVAIMKPEPESRALNLIFRDLLNTRDGATYVASKVWGIFTHYDLGGNHPLVGFSVPNFEFENGSTIGEMMIDGLPILLDVKGHPSLMNFKSEQVKYISMKAKVSLGFSALLIRPDGIIAWATDDHINEASVREALATFKI